MDDALHIEVLRYRYPVSDRDVVSIGELTLAPGEPALLTGHPGRGKPTLPYLIAGLIYPDAGLVRRHGTALRVLLIHI